MNKDLTVMGIRGGGYANLELVRVDFDKGVNKVGGKNRQGKSNLIDLIGIFRGKEYMAEVPLKKDEDKGKFEIPLVDGDGEIKYIVKYSFTKKHSYVTVTDEEGAEVPLKILKDLLSPCMDPSEFFFNATSKGKGAKDRRLEAINVIRELMKYNVDVDALLKAIGLKADTTIQSLISQHRDDPIAFLDAMDKHVSENRKTHKAKLADAKGTKSTLEEVIPKDKRDIEVQDTSEIVAKQQELQERTVKSAQALEKGQTLQEKVTVLEAQLETATAELEEFRKWHGEDASELHAAEELEKLTKAMADREEHNELARKAEQLREVKASIKTYEKGVEKRDDLIDKIRSLRTKTLENADMPIKGLSIEGDTILKDGIPLGQDSTEEGLTDSFMIGLAKFEAMHPDQERLKTMLIQNASLMDSDAKERLYDLAKENGIQLIVELVLDEPCQGVIFVDNGVAVNVEED